jgi:DNA (cytosine-5)-methyltransferase 1
MGFEHGKREWKIRVSDTQAYRQFGNAVVVPVIEAIAQYMKPDLLAAVTRSRTQAEEEQRRVA